MNEVQVDFFFHGIKKYGGGYSVHVPAIGDEVRHAGVAYKVEYRIWIYDEAQIRVAIDLSKARSTERAARPTRRKGKAQ